MTVIGYALAGENETATERVRHASRAEEAGFSFAILTDRAERHGTASDTLEEPPPYAWGVLGAIAQATSTIRVGAIVDVPADRAGAQLVARAAGTAQALMPGRFFLGLAAGDAGDVDPDRTGTAVSTIRERWRVDAGLAAGGHLDIGERRIHALPEPLPPIYLTASDGASARDAARFGDGLIGGDETAPVAGSFQAAGGRGPRIGRVAVCWATTAGRGRDRADGRAIACGPDPATHLAAIAASVAAGFDHVVLEQVGPDQAGFLRFAEGELLPALRSKTLRIAS